MIRFFDHGMGVFSPHRPIPPCRWDRFDLICVHAGRLELLMEEKQSIDLRSSQGVLIHPHTRFEARVTRGVCKASVQHFMVTAQSRSNPLPVILGELVGRKCGWQRVMMQRPAQVKADILRAIQLAFGPQSPRVHDQRVALLTLILSQLQPELPKQLRSRRGAWDELNQWLRDRLDQPVSVPQMAAYMQLSPAHFSVRFTQIFGQTPGRQFQRLRLQEAIRLLRESDQPIKTIAQQLRFNDLPNFYRAFREMTGVSPAAYRKRHALRG